MSTSVDDETTLSPQVETSILRETGVLSSSSFFFFFFFFFLKESKTDHSCSHRSSRSSSRWKVMVPKVTPYDVDLGPVCFLSRPSSCLRDKRPKQYQPSNSLKLSKKVRQEDAVAVVLESV